ncbi:MAG: UDP-N-acetylmuramoyl-tripeptide--D-alanyl-D-alanine ligase [Crocinitomicaceae bacterium]|nr:UDP-N-acetylmuramoyl-tripeptide--D-alanyl-D-alanine ligase [Crocinitomicaceae bacterium]
MKELFELFYKSSGVSTDTRKIQNNCLFIALKGDNFNGNSFSKQAINKGASFAIVDEKEFADNKQIFLVNDSLLFLQALARHHRKKINKPVIGITGTNGKTTTKELINCVLSVKYNVLATKGNLNNHIGVPLTLLEITPKTDLAVIEMGASKPGDIKELCDIALPNYGIITNIGNAHMEGFKTSEGVFKTKMELFDYIENTGGSFIYNGLDSTFDVINELYNKAKLFKFGDRDFINANLINADPLLDFSWKDASGYENNIKTKLVGSYNLANFLVAIVFGHLFKIESKKINKALCEYTPSNNRSQLAYSKSNQIIIDCYNANPSSMKAALKSIKESNKKNKVVILGDMLELGQDSQKEHQSLLDLAKKYKLEVYAVGEIFNSIQSDTIKNKFKTSDQALKHFTKKPIKNSVVLVKGSRGIALEKLIPAL